MDILIPYLHYIGIMILMGALLAEYFIVKQDISAAQIKSLANIDLVYGTAAVLVIVSGLLRWFVFDSKGAAYFNANPLFHIKLSLFVVIVILSLFPTMKFHKWLKQVMRGELNGLSSKEMRKTLLFIRIELLLLALIPVLAVMVELGKRFK